MRLLHTLSPFPSSTDRKWIHGSWTALYPPQWMTQKKKNSFRFLKMKTRDVETPSPCLYSFFFLFICSSRAVQTLFNLNSTSGQILLDAISNFENLCVLAIVLALPHTRLIKKKHSTDLYQIWYYLSVTSSCSWRVRSVILFINPQDEVGPSISSLVVPCSFVLLVHIVMLVLVVYLCPSSVRVVAIFSGIVLFPLLYSVLLFFPLIHWFFSLFNFVIPSKCLKNFIRAASIRRSSLFFSTQTSLPNFSAADNLSSGQQNTRKILKTKKRVDPQCDDTAKFYGIIFYIKNCWAVLILVGIDENI